MAGGFLSNRDIIAANMHFPQAKFEYSSGMIVFSGNHYVHKAATSHPKWMVKKYTYDGSNNLIDIQQLEGAWDDRATLDWN